MNKPKSKKENARKRLPQVIYFEDIYPEENPEGTLDEIVNGMEIIGLFDGIKR